MLIRKARAQTRYS